MGSSSFSVDLRRCLAVLLHWCWLLIAGTVFTSGAVYFISVHQKPVYEATSLVLVELPAAHAIDYNSVLASERLTRTYAERMATHPVLESVIRKTGSNLDVTTLQNAVKVEPVRDTQLIRVSVQARDPALAALLANTLVAEFSAADRERQADRFITSQEGLEAQLAQVEQQIREITVRLEESGQGTIQTVERDRLEGELEQRRQTHAALIQTYEQNRLAEAQSAAMIVQEEPAALPTRPVKPRILFNTLLAGAFGLLLAAGIVYLFESLDDSLHDPQESLHSLGLSILGLITHQDGDGLQPSAACQPLSPAAEAFRALRTNLDFAAVDHPLRSLLVASPTPADGKSNVAANLAVALAQAERRVLLVDADLRRPVQHKRFGIRSEPGLSDLFLKFRTAGGRDLDLATYLQPSGTPYLQVLVAGGLPPNPAELLGSESMLAIRDRLLSEAEVLIFDSPPVLAVTDAAVLAPRLDGVLLVVRPGGTKLAACRQAIEQLRWVGANLLGAVVNDAAARGSYAAYYRSPAAGVSGAAESMETRWRKRLAGRLAGWAGRRRGPAPE